MERILYTCLPGGRSHGARPTALDAGRLGVAAPTHAEAPLRKEQPAKRPQGTDDGHYPRDSHSPGREGGSGGQGLCPRPPGIWGDSQTAAGHGASSAAPWGPASSRHGAFAPEREPALTWLCLRLPRGGPRRLGGPAARGSGRPDSRPGKGEQRGTGRRTPTELDGGPVSAHWRNSQRPGSSPAQHLGGPTSCEAPRMRWEQGPGLARPLAPGATEEAGTGRRVTTRHGSHVC